PSAVPLGAELRSTMNSTDQAGKMASTNQMRSKVRALRPSEDGLPRGHVTEIQRARMLSAAVEAIEENGYARLTVAQVIRRAKVSRKTFYDLFVDREDCFLAVFERTLEQMRGRAIEAFGQESSGGGRAPGGRG